MSGNGHVISGTPIAVDIWQKQKCPQARIFFLSHLHTDHIVGLSRKWDQPIYTSEITGKLLEKKIGINPSLIKCLELNEDYLIPLDMEEKEMLTVRLLDANHCPGSVMFLFQGYFGNIFYSSDFRYSPRLMDFSDIPSIDVLYLDNTYCSPKCEFPEREVAIDRLLNRLHSCLLHSKRVFIGLDNLGKEEIYKAIAKETHSKIYVDENRKEILDLLGLSKVVTCDAQQCKVFIVPTRAISSQNMTRWNVEISSCAIVATARYCGFNFKPFQKFNNIHVIPVSNHSPFVELKEFVTKIHPKVIIPIVGKDARGIFDSDISERADMSIFNNLLNDSPRTDFTIPKTVKNAMLVRNNNRPTVSAKRKSKDPPTLLKKPKSKIKTPLGVQYVSDESSATESIPNVSEVIDLTDDSESTLNKKPSTATWGIYLIGSTKHVSHSNES